ncbi:MAG TPA: hypothetical protein VEY07_07650 [Thermoplasmata archaeon]|nr:hypothetical protein [Thermoplasmata archaeon]
MLHIRSAPGSVGPPTGRWAIGTLGFLLVILPIATAVMATSPLVAASPVVAPLASGPCGGGRVAAAFNGTLGIQGGGTPPSVSGLTVRALYDYQLDYTPRGGSTSVSCSTGSATATTDSQGRFTVTLSIPASGCSPGGCSNYTGPFAPTSFSVASPTPAGYFVGSSVNGSTVTLNFVYALASAGLSPFGRTTVSAFAPVVLTASGLAGNGVASPAALSFAWILSGSGWAVVSGAGTAHLTVVSGGGAGSATVVVFVNGTYNGTSESAPSRNAILTPAATSLVAESVNPTSLDAGAPATFSLTGSGAAGYAYRATIFPGLGVSPVSQPCSTTPASGGYVTLTCTVVVTYPTAGTAQPSANLTNGYSTAAVTFSPVVVAPALSIVLAPSPARGYVGSPISFTLSVGTGSGTAPFGPACFWPGDGTLSCAGAGATSWTFQHIFGSPGSYSGRATVADAAGSNRSVTVVALVTVVPTLTPFPLTASRVTLGTTVPLSALYSGGALPASFWWNDSLPSTTLSLGTISRDGTLAYGFVPTVAGSHLLTLTVVDGLGTVKRAQFSLLVDPGPAVQIVPIGGPGSWSTDAGSPYNVSWVAVDPAGEVVPTYGATVFLIPQRPAGPLWVNHTEFGPVLPAANGSFSFAPSDWRGGYLNFSIDPGTAGALTLRVTCPLPISDEVNGTLRLSVAYDRLHLVLRDPVGAPTDGINRTLWRISDRFTNPVPAGYVVVQTTVGGSVNTTYFPIQFNGTISVVWVNYSLPSGFAASVLVLSAWGQTLLPPLVVAAPAPAPPLDILLLVAFGGLAGFFLAMGVRSRRSEPAAPVPPSVPPTDSADAELRRLATGRAFVLSRADPKVPHDLADLVRDFPGIPPTPTELAEWVGSLVNEGQLRATLGPDGRPRFTRRNPGDPEPAADATPRVELDPKALEAALAQRPTPDEEGDEPPTA